MPAEPEVKEIKQAIGKRVEIIAFGIPYLGTLKRFNQKEARLVVQEGEDVAEIDLDRVESFKVIKTRRSKT